MKVERNFIMCLRLQLVGKKKVRSQLVKKKEFKITIQCVYFYKSCKIISYMCEKSFIIFQISYHYHHRKLKSKSSYTFPFFLLVEFQSLKNNDWYSKFTILPLLIDRVLNIFTHYIFESHSLNVDKLRESFFNLLKITSQKNN